MAELIFSVSDPGDIKAATARQAYYFYQALESCMYN